LYATAKPKNRITPLAHKFNSPEIFMGLPTISSRHYTDHSKAGKAVECIRFDGSAIVHFWSSLTPASTATNMVGARETPGEIIGSHRQAITVATLPAIELANASICALYRKGSKFSRSGRNHGQSSLANPA
jgi:hypothetical protein